MELRILEKADGTKVLQFREITREQYYCGNSMVFVGDWQDVPTVKEE